ncbi:hypothetical protein BDV98DRAFT_44343 [Pterulicium gracile]|uniref:tRNA-splicing endonuclease subunit Sen2 n=1 Tax=Pterulicium gracile TaxID=1884261 RepID=A0A5C3QJH0_9AGAR|nr:hypothetical protein BDV98DRAFT_44343 [Pterula gracilis]
MATAISNKNRNRGPGKFGGKRGENNRIYANPLPLLFPDPPSRVASVVGLLGLSLAPIENPHCTGVFDDATRSVWICNSHDSTILWRRGMFGKGDLSRSEPSWLARQTNLRNLQGTKLTSEEVTARRRAERKQFKMDRAKAIANAFAEAEAAFEQGVVIKPTLSGPNIPSAATWRPSPSTPQSEAVNEVPLEDRHESDEEDLPPLEDIEHLQLTLQEAFFLLWNLDCLTVLDPTTDRAMTLKEIWTTFQLSHLPREIPSQDLPIQPDNPFLVNYVVYHHYRSLGWVVKGGIKFCVDYLLYKKGPVFNHAELAVVVIPVYEDEEDEQNSVFSEQRNKAKPFSWTWLNTINRVNSQTLILTYVTIPSHKRVAELGDSPCVFKEYSVREVTIRRFIPARMRD